MSLPIVYIRYIYVNVTFFVLHFMDYQKIQLKYFEQKKVSSRVATLLIVLFGIGLCVNICYRFIKVKSILLNCNFFSLFRLQSIPRLFFFFFGKLCSKLWRAYLLAFKFYIRALRRSFPLQLYCWQLFDYRLGLTLYNNNKFARRIFGERDKNVSFIVEEVSRESWDRPNG